MKKLWTDEDLIKTVKESTNFCEVAEKLGLKKSSNSIRKRIKELQLSTTHWHRKKSVPTVHKYDIETILTINSPYTYTSNLKKILIKANLLINKCYNCGLIDWFGKPISLQLHHKNGINADNRLENLCILCPNCHSQTDSYSGKNNKIIRKAKHLVRYKCSHCEKTSTNNKFKTCLSCMKKYHLGNFKSKFNDEQMSYIIYKYDIEKISVYLLSRLLNSSADAIIKVLKDNKIEIRKRTK